MDAGTNTVDRTSANMRKSPSDLTDRSIKNVTTKVISSVDKIVGEKNSLYFLISAVKILDLKKKIRCYYKMKKNRTIVGTKKRIVVQRNAMIMKHTGVIID